MPLVLGVDSSTQSTKVELRDADSGELVASGRAPHPPTSPPRSEQDPHAWWDALAAAVAASGVAGRDVAAVSVAAQQHGLVTLDARGDVVRPAKLWNDTESSADAAWLLDQLGGPSAWVDACGSVPVASFTITKLSWLHRSEPDAWARLARVCLPHDWLTYRLADELVTDRGDASGTGYYSARDDEYRFDLLAVVDRDADWPARLPRVLGPHDAAGETNALELRAVVAPGTGDNMAAALGLGLQPGDVAVSIGTSGTVYAVSDRPVADPTGAVAGFADASGRFLPLVCTLNATKVTDAIGRILGAEHDRLDTLALAADPGAGGVVLVPYFDGERTPNRPDATGTIGGLRSDTTREQLARAAYEGVVCSLLEALDALAPHVERTGRIVLTGGGARSPAYRQIFADLSESEIEVAPDADSTVAPAAGHVALGACVQAAAVLHGCETRAVADAWQLGAGTATVAPSGRVDAGAMRNRYRAAHG